MAVRSQVTLSLERQGKKVDGVAMWGFWNREVWAQYPDGAQKCLWRAKPAYVTSSKCALILGPVAEDLETLKAAVLFLQSILLWTIHSSLQSAVYLKTSDAQYL